MARNKQNECRAFPERGIDVLDPVRSALDVAIIQGFKVIVGYCDLKMALHKFEPPLILVSTASLKPIIFISYGHAGLPACI
jgi:hypothetical protein